MLRWDPQQSWSFLTLPFASLFRSHGVCVCVEHISETFTTHRSDGSVVELCPGGLAREVTWDAREEYVRLVEAVRLAEGDEQVAAIRYGLGSIVSVRRFRSLGLFGWRLMLSVCLLQVTGRSGWVEISSGVFLGFRGFRLVLLVFSSALMGLSRYPRMHSPVPWLALASCVTSLPFSFLRPFARADQTELLAMYTWNELELMVCGNVDIDLALLRRNTKYDGCSADDAHVRLLWRVLEAFTARERRLFLRFVWGRTRLPHGAFEQKFKVQRFVGASTSAGGAGGAAAGDQTHLPSSHTCFFSLEWPRYAGRCLDCSAHARPPSRSRKRHSASPYPVFFFFFF